MSAESPRHVRSGGPLTVPSQPPSDRSIIDAVSGFINDVTLSSSSTVDPKDVIQWARFETADINEPTPEGDSDSDISPLLLILGYGSGVQVWLIPPTGEAQEVLSWRQGTVRVLRILPTPQHGDCFASKRPLIALCDSASPGPSFCSLSFISIRGGEQVKSIKFKNPILDVLANKRSVVVSFSERFAVFDAATLEDRMAVTTCYPCPCPLGGSLPINPLALGDRWLAYADKKLNQSKRSSGGCEGEGVTSYTATVLHAAKSLSKGLRGLGESVAHSLAGGRSTSQSPSPPNADIQQPGVVTILDIEGNEEEDGQDSEEPCDPIVAHFIAHSEAIIALKFDASGMLLVTADRRGHDFHVFRINPHPCGPSLASVHHLYILHRGDTTAKVQDIAISLDARWAAVSTLRGTTHVFSISPYGGACGVRTHTQPRVVNRLSRFHRSAGLPIHAATAAAAAKRASANAAADSMSQGAWFPNPRLPPYPLPTTVSPLAQLRPTANIPTHTITRTSSGRQRLSSVSEDSNAAPLLARARFGPVLAGAAGASVRGAAPVAALYLMAANGALLHLLLHPKPLSSIPKEKICDDSCIELEVSGVAQWPLQRPAAAADLLAPLPPSNPLLQPMTCRRCADMCMSEEERWLSQVEIVTHAGPHRRLWMGPQFVFKTYNCTGSNSSLSEAETVEVDPSVGGVARSNPVNMPGVRPVVPVLIDSGSASSLEHSPSDSFRRKSLLADSGRAPSVCDVQLREDLAEAMKEDHGAAIARSADAARSSRAWAVDPLGCVVQPAPPAPREPDAEPELYATSNADEATFRPVLRAPAPPEARPEGARPLPATTTIPVQRVAAPGSPEPPRAQPLPTAVLIPAALQPRASVDVVPNDVSEMMDARESVRESAPAERESERPPETLPKSRPADIQPTVESRVKRSPTPKSDSDKVASDASSKDSESRVRGSSRSRDFGEKARASEPSNLRNRKELEAPMKDKVKNAESEVPVKVEKVKKVTEASVKLEKNKKIEPVQTTVKVEKLKTMEPVVKESVSRPSIPKEIIRNESVQKEMVKEPIVKESAWKEPLNKELVKKEQTTKESVWKEPIVKESIKKDVILKESAWKEPLVKESFKKEPIPKESAWKEPLVKESFKKEPTPKESAWKEPLVKESFKKEPTPKESAWKEPLVKESFKKEPTPKESAWKEPLVKESFKKEPTPKESAWKEPLVKESFKKEPTPKESAWKEPLVKESVQKELIPKQTVPRETISTVDTRDDTPSVSATLKLPTKKKSSETKAKEKVEKKDYIKTEEQAWDMLLNEPEKPVPFTSLTAEDKVLEEPKPKTKRTRKNKKSQDDIQTKDEEDTFVEIHAIEDKQQQSSGELVSISTPYEELEPISYLAKAKKSRPSKSVTPERKEQFETRDLWGLETELTTTKYRRNDAVADIGFVPEINIKTKAKDDSNVVNTLKVSDVADNTVNVKDSVKPKKSKSLSPYAERKAEKRYESEVTDVYVIDTMKEEFPEIQITKGKPRKKSPQPEKRQEVEIVEQPIKSWSSIAASKNVKKDDKSEEKMEVQKKVTEVIDLDVEAGSSTQVSLQEKLIELCKRTDIMVAECDAPTELNFVDEHHSVLDLPPLEPLEPLDFGLDDFKLEVMRDSLLEIGDTKITSPICQINIDSILSTIKETTNKAIESSAFNLIDLEKMPVKKERGFSVVENDKITTQEVKIDDEKDVEVMEKSSDDDNTSPIVSTDSDKEDKKSAGACNITTPSTKQSSKSKKSRKKKK